MVVRFATVAYGRVIAVVAAINENVPMCRRYTPTFRSDVMFYVLDGASRWNIWPILRHQRL